MLLGLLGYEIQENAHQILKLYQPSLQNEEPAPPVKYINTGTTVLTHTLLDSTHILHSVQFLRTTLVLTLRDKALTAQLQHPTLSLNRKDVQR